MFQLFKSMIGLKLNLFSAYHNRGYYSTLICMFLVLAIQNIIFWSEKILKPQMVKGELYRTQVFVSVVEKEHSCSCCYSNTSIKKTPSFEWNFVLPSARKSFIFCPSDFFSFKFGLQYFVYNLIIPFSICYKLLTVVCKVPWKA